MSRGTPSCRTALAARWTTRLPWAVERLAVLGDLDRRRAALRFTCVQGAGGSVDVARLLRHGRRDPRLENGNFQRGGLAPVFTCDPRLRGRDAASFSWTSTASVPGIRAEGDSPSSTSSARRSMTNHDLTVFKNFPLRGRAEAAGPLRLLQPLQSGVRHTELLAERPDSGHEHPVQQECGSRVSSERRRRVRGKPRSTGV